jgi:transposase-like protein
MAVPTESFPKQMVSSPQSAPQSNVWYTLRSGEDIGHAVLLFGESTETIVTLNADTQARGLVYLPEERYAFYRPSGTESYVDIARRHGMTVAELLRWAGRWTDRDVWAAQRRDCPPDGCDDELATASTSEQLLVRRKN